MKLLKIIYRYFGFAFTVCLFCIQEYRLAIFSLILSILIYTHENTKQNI